MEKPHRVDPKPKAVEESLFEPGSHFYWIRYDRMLNGELLISHEEELVLAEDPNNYQDYLDLIARFVSEKAPGESGIEQSEKLEKILDDQDNTEELRGIVREFVDERTFGRGVDSWKKE
jgi:hypothetical protein